MKQKFTIDDEQVKTALKEIQQDSKQIANLKTIEDPLTQFIAGSTIRFLEFRIRNNEKALWKAGLYNFVLKKDMEKNMVNKSGF